MVSESADCTGGPKSPSGSARLRIKIIVSAVLPWLAPRSGLCVQEVPLLQHPGMVRILHFRPLHILCDELGIFK